MSDGHDEGDVSPETFPDWLAQIQSGYLQLTDLYEKERDYGAKLAELMARVQHEIGFPIPLNPIVLSAVIPNVVEAQLGEGAVVSYVDAEGNKGSRPLTLMPLETIIFTVHECTFRLKEIIAEKRRLMARRVRALERVSLELDKAADTLHNSRPDVEPELEQVDEPPEQELAVGVASPVENTLPAEAGVPTRGGLPETLGPAATEAPGAAPVPEVASRSPPEPAPAVAPVPEVAKAESSGTEPEKTPASGTGFEFKGSFKEKRHIIDDKAWGPE
jgi:hypothetical protein